MAGPGTTSFGLVGRRIWVAGSRDLVSSALRRRLETERCEILEAPEKLDLRRQSDVEEWVEKCRPQAIFLTAGTVGGILANDSRPGEFLYDNLAIVTSVIESARLGGVEKLLFLGSSCVYPRLAPQPIAEDALLTGPLEPTNQWYAVAKIAGIRLCRAFRRQYGCNFIAAIPANAYGPEDDYDLASSHVIPALIAKAHAAKGAQANELMVWGTGAPYREFIYADDLADALVFLMQNYSSEEHINAGVGAGVTIRELAETVAKIVGLEKRLRFDASKPDGMPRKLLASDKLFAMGWRPKTKLDDGLRKTYAWYVANVANGS
jgi:GDP-L-fucose synthase